MAYKGSSAQKKFGGNSGGGYQKRGGNTERSVETERAYNVACKVGDEFVGIGTVDKYVDSGNLTMSINKEALEQLPVSPTGWINKIRLFIPKDK